MKTNFFFLTALLFQTILNYGQTVTDIDGNTYNTVTIGTQIWMKENLKTTHYNNGDSLPYILDTGQWSNLTTGAYCNYNHNENNGNVFGKLYNWYAVVDNRNLCPMGWHTPADSEWSTLEYYLGGELNAGGKMKETGTSHWVSPNNGATNSSGFTALPGGARLGDDFWTKGYEGNFWSSTSTSIPAAALRTLHNDNSTITRSMYSKVHGFSLRCISDSTASYINENYLYDGIKIYPIPSIDKIIIDCSETQNLFYIIYNCFGEIVLQGELVKVNNEIDISSLTSGLLIISLTGADWTVQKKIIKK